MGNGNIFQMICGLFTKHKLRRRYEVLANNRGDWCRCKICGFRFWSGMARVESEPEGGHFG